MRIHQRIAQQQSPAVNGRLDAGIERWFTELDASAAQYYQLSSQLSVTGDFKIEFRLFILDAQTQQTILAGDDSTDTYFVVDISLGKFRAWSRKNSVTSSIVAVEATEGVLATYVVERSGGVLSVTHNGYVSSSSNDDVLDVVRIGSRASGYRLSGIVSDVLINADGVTVLDAPLDRSTPASGTIKNRAAGNHGSPKSLLAMNFTAEESQLFSRTGMDWVNEYWPNLLEYSGYEGIQAAQAVVQGLGFIGAHSAFSVLMTSASGRVQVNAPELQRYSETHCIIRFKSVTNPGSGYLRPLVVSNVNEPNDGFYGCWIDMHSCAVVGDNSGGDVALNHLDIVSIGDGWFDIIISVAIPNSEFAGLWLYVTDGTLNTVRSTKHSAVIGGIQLSGVSPLKGRLVETSGTPGKIIEVAS